jgi:thiol-disulfide isomerase/thioredoxin
MVYRIITHANCTDGFSSAFLVKKYFNNFFDTKLSSQEIKQIEVVAIYPPQMDDFELKEKDIVVDLPYPPKKVFFWCDHHITSKWEGELPKNYFWKKEASCAGFLIDILKDKGIKVSSEMQKFREVMDIIDDARYTKQQIKECYYEQQNYDKTSDLLKMQMIGAMFHTRDKILNDEIFCTILSNELGETPISSKKLWDLNPLMYHLAHLKSFAEWRENVDKYLEYLPEFKTVLQDDRKSKFSRGVADRFYVNVKYPEAIYNVNVKIIDDEVARFGIGSNIFKKDLCKINIGNLCRELGKKFSGAGGGHQKVGGASVSAEFVDEALQYILDKIKMAGRG